MVSDDQDNGAEEGGEADIGVEQKADRQIDRHPWQVEQRDRAHAGKECAHGIEIADWLRALALSAKLERQAHNGIIDPHAHRFVEAVTDADQDAGADRIDHALRGIKASGKNQQCHQRGHAAARQHPVVDFEHEQRAGEHQDIAHAAKQRDGEESPTAGEEGLGKFGACRRLPQRA